MPKAVVRQGPCSQAIYRQMRIQNLVGRILVVLEGKVLPHQKLRQIGAGPEPSNNCLEHPLIELSLFISPSWSYRGMMLGDVGLGGKPVDDMNNMH
mmetsp:Transcript_37903/g.82033  ORF Transcript_37903/g.82033 Transcript_37903/m.82033 type:complete len:96 (+) Transcript_37903:27-314(+)